jgi:hypothetical protein
MRGCWPMDGAIALTGSRGCGDFGGRSETRPARSVPSPLSACFAASGLQIGLLARLRHEWIALRFRASTAVGPSQAWSRNARNVRKIAAHQKYGEVLPMESEVNRS